MGQVVKFKRGDNIKEMAIKQLEEDKNHYHFYISFGKDPDQAEDITFYSDFNVGWYEIMAIEVLLETMKQEFYEIHMDFEPE